MAPPLELVTAPPMTIILSRHGECSRVSPVWLCDACVFCILLPRRSICFCFFGMVVVLSALVCEDVQKQGSARLDTMWYYPRETRASGGLQRLVPKLAVPLRKAPVESHEGGNIIEREKRRIYCRQAALIFEDVVDEPSWFLTPSQAAFSPYHLHLSVSS